jgi:hypothetical protein
MSFDVTVSQMGKSHLCSFAAGQSLSSSERKQKLDETLQLVGIMRQMFIGKDISSMLHMVYLT